MCAGARDLFGVGEEVGVEWLDEKKSSDFRDPSGVLSDVDVEEESNKPTAFCVKLEVASLMIRNQGGIFACMVTVKSTYFDRVMGRRELM